jgi:hypothetical protein
MNIQWRESHEIVGFFMNIVSVEIGMEEEEEDYEEEDEMGQS